MSKREVKANALNGGPPLGFRLSLLALLVAVGGVSLVVAQQLKHGTFGSGTAPVTSVENGFSHVGESLIGPSQTENIRLHAGVVPVILRSLAPRGNGDKDRDGDVDLQDVSGFQACFDAPPSEVRGVCAAFDFVGDKDVDLPDYKHFRNALTRPR